MVKMLNSRNSGSDETPNVAERPEPLLLLRNFPNPFNPATTIVFELPTSESVTLRVFNILGQQVAGLLSNASFESDKHSVVWMALTLLGNA